MQALAYAGSSAAGPSSASRSIGTRNGTRLPSARLIARQAKNNTTAIMSSVRKCLMRSNSGFDVVAAASCFWSACCAVLSNATAVTFSAPAPSRFASMPAAARMLGCQTVEMSLAFTTALSSSTDTDIRFNVPGGMSLCVTVESTALACCELSFW